MYDPETQQYLEIIDDQRKIAFINGQEGITYIQPVIGMDNQINTGIGSRHVQIANMIAQYRH